MKYLKYVDKKIPRQDGKVFVVTGATNGIGFALSKQLAYLGAKVIMAVRNLDKAKQRKEEILREVPNANIEIYKYDQADFSLINEFVNSIKDIKIDVLVLNAGIYHPTNNSVTVDGYPLTVGTNYLGAYYLVNKLDSMIRAKIIKRIVVTSSLVHVFGHTKHYEKYILDVKNRPNRVYNVSKQMNYILAANIKNKYPDLEVVLTHPGIARTNIIKSDCSSFKTWFKFAGDRFMKIFANSAEKSAISSLIASTKEDIDELDFVFPRGLFHCVGYPKIVHRKVNKIKDESLELASNKLIGN